MRRYVIVPLLLFGCSVLGFAWASPPTCDTLVEAFQASFDDATAYRVSVAIEQGEREIAYELVQQTRLDDGSWASESLERRGLRRPGNADQQDGDGTFGDIPISCEGHEIEADTEDHWVLSLAAPERDEGAITGWSIRFDREADRWLPLELVASFETRIVFVPVRGRFVTTLSDWQF